MSWAAERARPHCARDGGAHIVAAVLLEEHVEILDATPRDLRLAMRGLGEQRESIGDEIEDLLRFS
jgi:NTP pyrophosphatase (non-canonical NTP hydrolase)